MKMSDWHVAYNTKANYKCCYYGPLDEMEETLGSDFAILPDKEWTIDDLVEIVGNLLEDVNLHSRIEEPRDLVNMMRAVDISDDQIRLFMIREYLPVMFNKYGEGY